MSTKRLTADERATHLLGEAVLRQLTHAPRDPETLREISALSRWVVHWLTEDELAHVTTHTGYLFEDEVSPFGPRGQRRGRRLIG